MKCLDALMQELCPDGVEFVKLGEVCNRNKGISITAAKMKEINKKGAPVRIFAAGNTKADVEYCDIERKAVITSPSVIIKSRGNIGFEYYDEPFSHKAEMWSYSAKDSKKIDIKFLFYYLSSKTDKFQTRAKANAVKLPQLSIGDTDNYEIPLPPISIQAEIVRILDTFTSLEAELDTELDCRKRQYAYYRDTLLSFEGKEGVAWKKLGEVCEILDSKRKPVAKGNRVKGDYPYYGANGIQDYIDGYLFDGVYLLLGEDGSVINKDNSPILNWATGKIWVNNHAHVLAEKKGEAILRYLYYVLQTCDVSPIVRGVPPKLNQENLRNIEFPIPSLEEQRRIVAILDRFESLTTSLQSGLPAEIAARRQQYAHYRDKLLTFRRKGAN